MTKKRLLRHWKGHLLHGLVLAGGFFYFCLQVIYQKEMIKAAGASASATLSFIEEENEYLLSRIYPLHPRYFEKKNNISRRINWNKALLDSISLNLISTTSLKPAFLLLADSLRIWSDFDTATVQKIESALQHPDMILLELAWSHILPKNDGTSTDLANLLKLRMQLAANASLRYCHWMTEPVNTYPEPLVRPVVWSYAPPPRVGRPFHVEAFATALIPLEKGMTIRINGREYPVVKGAARYKNIFPKPGRYTFKVEIEAPPHSVPLYKIDSITIEKRLFEKEFEVWVQ